MFKLQECWTRAVPILEGNKALIVSGIASAYTLAVGFLHGGPDEERICGV